MLKQTAALQRFSLINGDLFATLTDREIVVLTLVAEGLDNPAIARGLEISRSTVQNHRARIRDKLNIIAQPDYIIFALAYDLIHF
ncbi:MAG: helix-turn-helix transcriptional regulator [Balneolales bacterium]